MTTQRRRWLERMRNALAASLRSAGVAFSEAGKGASSTIHDARKELKRSASLARGFGHVLGAQAFSAVEASNVARRAFGRARDLDVLPLALQRVKCEPESRAILTRAIALERGAAVGELQPDGLNLSGKLTSAADTVQLWDLGAYDDDAFTHLLRQTYKVAKRRGAAAFATGDADDLHGLRRGVIDVHHQLEILSPAWPDLIDAQCQELRKLRQTLGDFNDLTMLGEFALAQSELPASAGEAFVEAVQRRRRPLERNARVQFERAFAEQSGAFARRLAVYIERPKNKG